MSVLKKLLVLAFFATITIVAFSQDSTKNEYCPVTPTDLAEPDIHTEYKGETIYFCCKSCLRDFNKDPEAYLANLAVAVESGDHGEAEHGSTEEQAHGKDDGHEHGDSEHDHSDHGESGSSPIISLLGKLHVLAVHFPVALIPFAALLAILSPLLRKPAFNQLADISLFAGAFAAVGAAIMGWIAASQSSYPDNLSVILEYHRWLGTSVATLAVLVSAVILYWPKTRYRIPLYAALTLLVLTAGHFGGSLIYGPDYLF
ncbi:YHS domain-containing protein [Pelagicoccus sp. SDUM812002]|uniref:YHS domain-containing protein n=1 Tax=Pelagicoccus sp. SDUM812002 TaxID=3041266 RepID=UPI00280D7943|nr:YHS domain-containing protein [Pelagicoccus sp. SDUM812002]MDQ8188086.1 YHS domain-containing protein [Pelagicoccus sp. SDUM812002]